MSECQSKKVRVTFFLGNTKWASRDLFYVPRVGEEVVLRSDKIFSVEHIVWILDRDHDSYDKCNIVIKEIED